MKSIKKYSKGMLLLALLSCSIIRPIQPLKVLNKATNTTAELIIVSSAWFYTLCGGAMFDILRKSGLGHEVGQITVSPRHYLEAVCYTLAGPVATYFTYKDYFKSKQSQSTQK